MGAPLALPVVISVLAAASLDVDLGLHTEGRSSRLVASGLPAETRASYTAVPRVAVVADASTLHLTTAYTPRIWANDVASRSSPLVNHAVDARVETRPDRTWRAQARANALRGEMDPLADPLQVATTGSEAAQLASTDPVDYEEIRAGLRGELSSGLRTTLGAGVALQASRGLGAEARAVIPLQRRLSLDASLVRLATERDTLTFTAAATATATDVPPGADSGQAPSGALLEARSLLATGRATWRRRLGTQVDGWLGGGAAFVRSDPVGDGRSSHVLPMGEAGLARAGDAVDVQIATRLTTMVDRFTGDVSSMADASCAVVWRVGQGVSLASSASGGTRIDGETALATGDVRVAWRLRERLGLAIGVMGRWQHERRPELPSFVAGAAFASISYTMERIFRSAEPAHAAP